MFSSVIEFFKSAIMEQIIRDPVWATAALVGQVIFGGRFVLQWIVSEYKKKSHVPTAFWFMSLAGSLILLSYSIHIKNPVFMLGFSLNTLIYLRNLHLIYRRPQETAQTAIDKAED
ncbi:MAG TPA: lipid-A-disaccharide synthase N-terminal domain-containing protein [Sedimentisphaerales bacterium]|nr:lipid-A-disaccharide synthase N-terminal domain-containing protein [Sedimentisphaerales bacterium]